MKVEVTLVLISVSLDKVGTNCYLIKREDGKFQLPTIPINEKSSLECASQLLALATPLKPTVLGVGWVDLLQCPLADSINRVVDGERLITVPYGAMIPCDSAIDESIWVPTSEILSLDMYLDHKEIFQAVCIKLLRM